MTNVVQFPAPPQVEPPAQEWGNSVTAFTSFGTKIAENDTPDAPSSMSVRAVWHADSETNRLEFMIEECIPFGSKRQKPRLIKFSVSESSFTFLSGDVRRAQKRLAASQATPRSEG